MERVFVPCQGGCFPPAGGVAPARGQALVLGHVSPAKTQHQALALAGLRRSTLHTGEVALPQ